MAVPKSKSIQNTNSPEGNAIASVIPVHKNLTKDQVEVVPLDVFGEWVAILPIDEKKAGTILVVDSGSIADMYPVGVVVGIGDGVSLNMQVGSSVAFLPKMRAMELQHPAYDRPVFIINCKHIFCRMG